jgi:hypothetical protein
MMMHGAKRSSTPRRVRRIVPGAERRLRSAFPEVWAWYELLVAARELSPNESALDEPETPRRRTSARR